MRRELAVALPIGLVIVLAISSDALRARAHRAHTSAQRYEDVSYLPPESWLPVLSLGHREALADALWMRALVYFGDELTHGGGVGHAFDYADAIQTLDPRFRAVYHWIGMAALYHPGDVPPEDIERAVEFMERGARIFPDDGPLAWDIGATLVFELAPRLEDRHAKRSAQERGAEYLVAAARRGAAPDWAVLSNASLLSRVGRAEQAARHLEEMYLAVSDERTRERIAARIHELRQEARAEAFVQAMRELETSRVRNFPYVPATLFLFVGERPPLDTTQPLRVGFAEALAEP